MKNEVVEGLDEILATLTTLETKSADKVLAAMIRGQMAPIQKQMKADTDSKVKEGRKGVRSRFKNNKKKNWILAKVGFGVGPKKTQKPRRSKRTGRGGVGISAQNIHWWVAGTKERRTKGHKVRTRSQGHSTGKMPSFQPGLAAIAATKSSGKQNAEMIKRGALALEKEVLKLKK